MTANAQNYTCGTPKLGALSSAFVVGGSEAVPGFLPWNLRLELFVDSTEEYELICGAVLIDPLWALTSARCIVEEPCVLSKHIHQFC